MLDQAREAKERSQARLDELLSELEKSGKWNNPKKAFGGGDPAEERWIMTDVEHEFFYGHEKQQSEEFPSPLQSQLSDRQAYTSTSPKVMQPLRYVQPISTPVPTKYDLREVGLKSNKSPVRSAVMGTVIGAVAAAMFWAMLKILLLL